MRIGMMADVYKPHINGITNYIALSKKYLEELGHEVFVFTFSEAEYQDEDERVIRSPGVPLLDTGYYLSVRYTSQARKLLQTVDVAHVHHPFLSGSLALLYCRPRGIPIVFTNHTRYDLYTQAYLPPMADALGLTAVKAYLPVFCDTCDLVISPSEGMKKVLQDFGVESPVEVVPNGVDLKPFQSEVCPIERSQLGLLEHEVVLVYVGRLGPEKNLAFLLRAFSGVAQAYEHVRLILIGDGPEREILEGMGRDSGISSSLRFLGKLPYEQIPCYLAVADTFVTASVTEVHPLTVIEAMAAGLPVLGICSPGVGDIVEDGVTGYLAAQPDLASFTAKMARLVNEGETRRRMGEAARRASSQYAIERTTGLIEACYARLIEQARQNRRGVRSRLQLWLEKRRQR